MESTKKNQNDPKGLAGAGDDPIGWFEALAEDAEAVQTRTLRRILEQNRGTEYLQKWLGEVQVQDLEDSELESLYRKLVPLAKHVDFEPYIQRIADGDTNPILTQEPITTLSLTSGTTEGRPKYIPFNMDYVDICRTSFLVDSAFIPRAFPRKEGGKILSFTYCDTKTPKTKGGLTVGSVTTLSFNILAKANELSSEECSPWEIASMGEHKQLTYCHLLLGLFFSEKVELIASNFAHIMVQAFVSLEELWKDLCRDLKEGTLSPRIGCPKMRKMVLDIIAPSPNPSLALEIEDKCRELEGLGWFGLIPKLWPNAKYVRCIATGSMKLYAKKLRHYLRDLPLVCGWHVSSESLIGLNINPSDEPDYVCFSVIPYASYFEFIPLHKEKHLISSISVGDNYIEDEPIPLSQTKIGQEYEIVLTTFTGLYRYRLGDVVEVAGFHKKTPKLKFVCRRNVCLSVNIDKTTEKDLEIVVERGSQLLRSKAKADLVDYTSHTNVLDQPGHYVIYWEVKGGDDLEEENTSVVLQECCTEMDKLFADICYIESRESNDIGPLELCVVERGTFNRVFCSYVENGGNVGQFKTPRCTNNQAFLGVLKACTIKRFHSTAYGNTHEKAFFT